MLELRSFHRGLKRISAGFLSKLVQLEELHMVGVEYCSYSILRELEFLSRLTALTLIECAKDVIYSNLGFSSKLTQYALTVGNAYRGTIDDCGKKIALEATETTPLGDWICHLLKESEVVHSTGKGSNKVLTELQLNKFQNVKCLSLFNCNLLILSHEVTKFPNLYELRLESLECLTHFCSDNVEGIEFPQLQRMILWELPKFQNFCPTSNNSITHENPLFNEKVSCPNLEEFSLSEASSISALCSHQLPTAYFTKHRKLKVWNCGKLRNLMSPLVARGLVNLQNLYIRVCESMEEVITKGEGIMTLFPQLEKLYLRGLPKLGHFFLTQCTLEFSLLREVFIHGCPKMKTFVQQGLSVSTPSLKRVSFNYEVMKVDDLNILTQQRFNCKEQKASQGTTDGNKSEASDDDESEATDGNKSEANDSDESRATDGDKSEVVDDSKG